jgi:hypothetical protein
MPQQKTNQVSVLYLMYYISAYEYPPYNGFGDELDSLGNCNRLILKPPKKDYFKYIDNDNIILRLIAKLTKSLIFTIKMD